MLVLSNSTEHCLSWREPVSQWYYQRWYVMGTQRQWPSNTDSHTMSCGETISSDLIKPWLVFCEAHGQPPCSLWFIVRGAAGDGGQTRGWPAQHQAGDLWDQPRDPEADSRGWECQVPGKECLRPTQGPTSSVWGFWFLDVFANTCFLLLFLYIKVLLELWKLLNKTITMH